ncbi:hypothetical protein BH20ACT11_BH20ACT11_12200 [soil metagenome]
MEKLAELQKPSVSDGLPEEEADRSATEAAREIRAEIARDHEFVDEEGLPPPTSEEVRERERKRKERV